MRGMGTFCTALYIPHIICELHSVTRITVDWMLHSVHVGGAETCTTLHTHTQEQGLQVLGIKIFDKTFDTKITLV